MKKALLSLMMLALVATTTFKLGADENDSNASEEVGHVKLDTLIDPDRSIFGLPLGATEDEIVEKMGEQPLAYIRGNAIRRRTGEHGGAPDNGNSQEKALVYSHAALLLSSGRLVGLYLSLYSLLPNFYETYSQIDSFLLSDAELPGGIKLEKSSLADIKRILGDRLVAESNGSYYYLTANSKVTLSCNLSAGAKSATANSQRIKDPDSELLLDTILIQPRGNDGQ